ncbi:helix-turn-helix domain-containing protein [Streptomonospora arabica]|uniref:Helix-turn-helix domain-containing protein n=1 Tax=Streptomonospora arabica TaxID=412417 RepID=A0ABV9SQD1_9ACTN
MRAVGEQASNCAAARVSIANGDLESHVHTREFQAMDVTVTDFATTIGLDMETPRDGEDVLRLFIVRRGAWTLRYGSGEIALGACRFMLRRSTGLIGYKMLPRTSGLTVGLPAEIAKEASESIIGSAAAPEVRLLLAYASVLLDTINDLTEVGLNAARNALIELARGVVRCYVDGAEPTFAPALVLAAREIADQRLTQSELTPGMLARELNVSVRTLSRAFASTAESVGSYLRRRRLEEARRELAAGYTVTQVAARWQFADSSHFVRAFRKHHGCTPTEYLRRLRLRSRGR